MKTKIAKRIADLRRKSSLKKAIKRIRKANRKHSGIPAGIVVMKQPGGGRKVKKRHHSAKAIVKRSYHRARALAASKGFKGASEMAMAVGEGAAGAAVSALGFGLVPMGQFQYANEARHALQAAAGFVVGTRVKNKHAKYLGYGAAVAGTIGLLAALAARAGVKVPVFAGEVGDDLSGSGDLDPSELGALASYPGTGMGAMATFGNERGFRLSGDDD